MQEVTYNIAKGIQQKLDYLLGLASNLEGSQTLIQLPTPIPSSASTAATALETFLVEQAKTFVGDQISAAETDFDNLQDDPLNGE